MSQTMFYSYDEEYPLRQVVVWEEVRYFSGVNQEDNYVYLQPTGDKKTMMKVFLPSLKCCVKGIIFTKSPSDAENGRRTAILSRMSQIKLTRAKLARELKKIRKEVNSWSLENKE